MTERPSEYPLGPWELGLEKAFQKLRGRPRHSGLNALRCLRRAWCIAELDPEMALFRAITAEEEAATALITALQIRRYPGAKTLNPWNHAHKAGCSIFLRIVETVLAEAGFPSPTYRLQDEGPRPRLDVHIRSETLGLPPGYFATPEEPLSGFMQEGKLGDDDTRVMTFEKQVQRRLVEAGARDMLALLRAGANLRNELLYASDKGITVVKHPDAALIERRRPVSLLLTLTIAILQTPKHQAFAAQILAAYLRALGSLLIDPFDYSSQMVDQDLTILVEKFAGGQPNATLRRRP